jgi:TetR/AcrR family transcriptional regulator, repressor of fatR-cypB operon
MHANTQKQTASRDKVLATALSLFTRKGYFNTSMRDITATSAVSTGSVYHYFKDKEGVAFALYQGMLERMRDSLLQIVSTNETSHDQCRAVIRLLFKIADEEPEVMSFMLYTKHHEFLHNERPICSSEPFEIMRSMVQFGMDNGEIEQQDLMVASTCLFGGAIRMITSHLDGLLEKPLSNYLDDTWTCSWRAVASNTN